MQTIENFFDFAFLIKGKAAAESTIQGEYDGLPVAIATDDFEGEKQQLVISLGRSTVLVLYAQDVDIKLALM